VDISAFICGFIFFFVLFLEPAVASSDAWQIVHTDKKELKPQMNADISVASEIEAKSSELLS